MYTDLMTFPLFLFEHAAAFPSLVPPVLAEPALTIAQKFALVAQIAASLR